MTNTEQLAARLADVEEQIGRAEDRQDEILAEGLAAFGAGFNLYRYCPESFDELVELKSERRYLKEALGL